MGEQVFGAGDKLKWIEQIVRDLGCTGFDVRVAVEISRRTNTGTGEATVSPGHDRELSRQVGSLGPPVI